MVNDNDNISGNRSNFPATLEAFAKIDPILKEHLPLSKKKNARMMTWKVQKEIISWIAPFIRSRIKEIIDRETYYAITADKVTDKYANKVILVCLHYLNYLHEKPKVKKIFFNSVHIHDRTTGNNTAQHITVLTANVININGCCCMTVVMLYELSMNILTFFSYFLVILLTHADVRTF